MSMYIVTKVRRELSADRRHRHIEGVCTSGGVHYTRREVAESIARGDVWQTSAGGYIGWITTLAYCPQPGCLASPYLKTDPDSTGLDNLENLPDC